MGNSGLPAGNRLTGYVHFFRQLFLGESPLGAQFQKDFFGIHVDHHLARIVPQREQKAKQLAVAPILLCSHQAYQYLTSYIQRIAPSGICGLRKALLCLFCNLMVDTKLQLMLADFLIFASMIINSGHLIPDCLFFSCSAVIACNRRGFPVSTNT